MNVERTEEALERRVRWLWRSQLLSWGVVGVLVVSGFGARGSTRAEVVRASRIEVVAENGQPMLVLGAKGQLPGPSMNGKQYAPELADGRQQLAGMIFFNEQGDEVGGLLFNGLVRDSGYSALGHLSLDQWKQNQVVALQYLDNGNSRRAGLRVWDRSTTVPMDVELDRLAALRGAEGARRDSLRREQAAARERGESGVERVFIGSQNEVAQLQLRDASGRVRARLVVAADSAARLEFLDERGVVVDRYPSR